MRKDILAEKEIYHVYNRGLGKQKLFLEDKDYLRFIFYIIYLQSGVKFPQPGRLINHLVRPLRSDRLNHNKRLIDLICLKGYYLNCSFYSETDLGWEGI